MVGGSAGTEQTDERENAPDGDVTVAKNADGYTEGILINYLVAYFYQYLYYNFVNCKSIGIPGPVTRLFVLANRGLANLIQDLILVSFIIQYFY